MNFLSNWGARFFYAGVLGLMPCYSFFGIYQPHFCMHIIKVGLDGVQSLVQNPNSLTSITTESFLGRIFFYPVGLCCGSWILFSPFAQSQKRIEVSDPRLSKREMKKLRSKTCTEENDEDELEVKRKEEAPKQIQFEPKKHEPRRQVIFTLMT